MEITKKEQRFRFYNSILLPMITKYILLDYVHMLQLTLVKSTESRQDICIASSYTLAYFIRTNGKFVIDPFLFYLLFNKLILTNLLNNAWQEYQKIRVRNYELYFRLPIKTFLEWSQQYIHELKELGLDLKE